MADPTPRPRKRRALRRSALAGGAIACATAVVILVATSGSDVTVSSGLRLGPGGVPLHVHRIARRVERLRGLRFDRLPAVRVVSTDQLDVIGKRLGRAAMRARGRTTGVRRRAWAGFEELAGTLPNLPVTDIAQASTAEQIGGAYDYRHHRILLVQDVLQTRLEVKLVLAHELTHALEDQHFNLHLSGITKPGQAAQARRALIEGTATFVTASYERRYFGDKLPVRQRLLGHQSLFAAASGAWAGKAQTIFNYVDGPLFVERLYRQDGGWPAVNDALRHPPIQTAQILHPGSWPGDRVRPAPPLRLGAVMPPAWRPAGRGIVGEEDIRGLLGLGAPELESGAASSGWDGGRFELWVRRDASGGCPGSCSGNAVGVAALRWKGSADAHQFAAAFYPYALLGRLATMVGAHTWNVGDGYAAVRETRRASAMAFAPTGSLAGRVAARAARAIAPATRGGGA